MNLDDSMASLKSAEQGLTPSEIVVDPSDPLVQIVQTRFNHLSETARCFKLPSQASLDFIEAQIRNGLITIEADPEMRLARGSMYVCTNVDTLNRLVEKVHAAEIKKRLILDVRTQSRESSASDPSPVRPSGQPEVPTLRLTRATAKREGLTLITHDLTGEVEVAAQQTQPAGQEIPTKDRESSPDSLSHTGTGIFSPLRSTRESRSSTRSERSSPKGKHAKAQLSDPLVSGRLLNAPFPRANKFQYALFG